MIKSIMGGYHHLVIRKIINIIPDRMVKSITMAPPPPPPH